MESEGKTPPLAKPLSPLPQPSLFKSFAFYFPILAIALMLTTRILDAYYLPGQLYTLRYSLIPRMIEWPFGIAFFHFIHGSWGHLTGNLTILIPSAYSIILLDRRHFIKNTVAIALLCGAGTWVIGIGYAHCGASGLIFGYIGFLCTMAYISKRKSWQILGSLNTLALGYSMGYQMIVNKATGFSWEAHLCGGLAGIYIAIRHEKRHERELRELDESEKNSSPEEG